MTVLSPKYSFVDFENRLEDIVLKAIDSMAVAFQFSIAPAEAAPIAKTFGFGVANSAGDTVLQAFNDVAPVCLWGVITGINLDADFPFTVTDDQIIDDIEYKTKEDFFDALQASGVNANAQTFLQCCDLNDVTDLSIPTDKGTITITFYAGVYQVTLPATGQAVFNTNPIVDIGECFRYYIKDGDTIIATSNLFQRAITNDQYTWITYSGDEDQYAFYYSSTANINQLWLPMYVRKPQYPKTRKVYLKSNKSYKVLSALTEKTREVAVDYIPELLHDRIAVMLDHDNIHLKSPLIDADVFLKDNYDVDDIDVIKGTILGSAKFTVTEKFEGRNSNCDQRIACQAFPGAGGGPVCDAVDIPAYSLPDAQENEIWDVLIPITGDAPFTLVWDVGNPAWITTHEISGSNVHLSGTPANADIGTAINISFTVQNCSGANSKPYSDTIDVTAAPAVQYGCGDSLGGSDLWTDISYHNYGYYYLDTITGSPATININWDVTSRPNRLTVIDETTGTVTATTGWKGVAAYTGPWGASLSTATTGTLSFNPVAGHVYKLQVEAGNGDGSTSDSWTVTINCA